MTRYQKIIRIIVGSISFLAFLVLLVGIIFYLCDVKFLNQIKTFFQSDTMPFIITMDAIFFVIGSFELYLAFKVK